MGGRAGGAGKYRQMVANTALPTPSLPGHGTASSAEGRPPGSWDGASGKQGMGGGGGGHGEGRKGKGEGWDDATKPNRADPRLGLVAL